MSVVRAVRVAIIADTEFQQNLLEDLLKSHGFVVVLGANPMSVDDKTLQQCQTDLWVVDRAMGEDFPVLDRLLANTELPVLYGEGNAPNKSSVTYFQWERGFLSKLRQLVGDRAESISEDLETMVASEQSHSPLPLPDGFKDKAPEGDGSAPWVWLLAGCRGAPAAVRSFLTRLPVQLPLGFVYAQHMQAGQDQALAHALAGVGQWQVSQVDPGQPVRAGEVVVISASHQQSFDKDLHLGDGDQPWALPYAPSFDQIILNIAQRFGTRFGVILFSGIGHAGSGAIPYALRKGAQVWTQRPDSCTSPLLPQAIIKAGYSGFSGGPAELAAALIEHIASQAK